jgi:predicted GNAT family acetyltransferase
VRVSERSETKTVADNPRERRYEIHLNGELAGYCAYQRLPETIVFTHTEIEPRFRGRGVGSRLIAAALADAERQQLRVIPRCDFVQDFIRLRPDPVASPASSP